MKLSRRRRGQYEIKTKEECAFEVKKLPNNQTCNHQNALSLLDWKKLGDKVMVRMRLKYVDSKNVTGIFPQKPGLFLMNGLEMKAGKLYCLINAQNES